MNFGAAASDTWVMINEGDTIWYDFNEETNTARVTFNVSCVSDIYIPEDV